MCYNKLTKTIKEVLIMEQKRMNDDELENVSGGVSMCGPHFSGKVDPGACVVGKDYYVVNFTTWYYGTLVEAVPGRYAGDFDCVFHAKEINGAPTNLDVKVSSAMVEIYTAMSVDL